MACAERTLAMEKMKKRRAETRRKIEFGGLVVKAGLDGFNKAVVLGVLVHAQQLITNDENQLALFESLGEKNFLD